MASASTRKRLEKVSGAQYALVRFLTDRGGLDAASVELVFSEIVEDRFKMARGLLAAAKLLANSEDPLVRRSSVSRAYYAAYQAARATVLWVHHRDEGDHERLAKEIDSLRGLQSGCGTELKELRTRRNEFDYSPNPGSNEETAYEDDTIEAMIVEGVETAGKLVDLLVQVVDAERRKQ